MACINVTAFLAGPDTHMTAQVHFNCYLPNIRPIAYRANLSFQYVVFLNQLKYVHNTRLLKKPTLDPDTACSYTPISDLSFISKLVKRLVAKRFIRSMSIYTVCCQPNSLPTDPSTLRHRYSIIVHNDLVCAVDGCRVSQLVLSDHSAAFDTMGHQILLQCCPTTLVSAAPQYTGSSLTLHEQTQSFVYAGRATDCFPVTCSVPQGSISDLLVCFTAYTEDLTAVSEKHSVHSH